MNLNKYRVVINFLVFILLWAAGTYYFFFAQRNTRDNTATEKKIDLIIRKGTQEDRDNLKILYQRVAAKPGRLVRTTNEISDEFVDKSLGKALNKGIIIVAEYDTKIIGAMIKFRPEPNAFVHILSDGSILVDPEYQGIGIGTKMITAFLEEIKNNHPKTLRLELIVRESNPAIRLYKKLGFIQEGRFEQRIRTPQGKLEADIPMVWFNPGHKEYDAEMVTRLQLLG